MKFRDQDERAILSLLRPLTRAIVEWPSSMDEAKIKFALSSWSLRFIRLSQCQTRALLKTPTVLSEWLHMDDQLACSAILAVEIGRAHV